MANCPSGKPTDARLTADALIARLAVKSKNFIVTVDTDDFEIIKKDMKQLVIVSAKEFFGH